MEVYVFTDMYVDTPKVLPVATENLACSLNEWAGMWPNDIFFFYSGDENIA